MPFDYGISTSGSTYGSGRLTPDTRQLDFRLVKRQDRGSLLLNLYVCQQRSMREAKILIVGSDGSKVLYRMAYTLKNVMITSITTSASDSSGAEPLESMSFSYEGITWEYTPVHPGGDPIRTSWTLTLR
ncbi:MAG: type VI secretion system tube protein Hcp [Bacillota bacterium]|nr:type VI secretion system tube protein Hcp [Bacillota bacterium]